MIPIQTESAWRGASDRRHCGIRDMVLFADLNFGTARQRVSNFILKMRSSQDGHTVTLLHTTTWGTCSTSSSRR